MIITGKRIIQKILAILVILTMTMAQLTMVGVNLISYAVDQVKVNNANVGFNVYFLDENKSLETTATVNKGDLKLAIEVNVKKDGYLADGRIQLEDSANFKFKAGTSNSYVTKVEDKAIYLKQINEGETATIEVGVEFLDASEMDLDYLSKASKLSLSGNYVNSKNVEKEQRVEIDGEAQVKVNWKSPDDVEASVATKLLTNSTLTVDGSNKKVVQLLVSSCLKNNSYPVKSTNIELNIPGEPENVTVHKRYTNASNGDREFTGGKYENGKLTINVENGQDNKISWKKGATDTFVVTLTYPENAELEGSKVTVSSTLTTYDEKTLLKSAELLVEKNVEGLVTVAQVQTPKEISKGDLYAGQEKSYTTVSRMYVDYSKAVEGIELEEQKPVFVEGENEKVANTEYVQTSINKNQFTQLFGENGTLEVKDQKGNTVQVVTNESETDENGNVVVKYDSGVTNISVVTSNPVSEGILEIRDEEKVSKGYSREELSEVSALKNSNQVTYTKNDTNDVENNSRSVLGLTETSSKASLTVEPVTLSTNQEEQEMHMTVVLESDNENRDLYKDAEIKITLPKQINKVKAEGSLLYGNGLELSDFKVSHDDNNMFITAKLSGEQKSYPGEAVKGATLDIVAKVTLNRLATTGTEQIKLNYTNANAKTYADNGEQKVNVQIMGQDPMIVTNDIEEYNVSTIGKLEDKKVNLDINSDEKTATVKMQVVNNEESDISNVVILGKIANVSGKVERTSNIGVSSKNVQVYYTTVANPTTNVSDTKNGWTNRSTENATYYLIVVGNMKNAEKFNFSYDIKMAEKLSYNISTETAYIVSYKNDLTGKEKTAESTKIVLTTGSVAELGLGITAEVGGETIKEGDTVKAGEIITYNVALSNTGREKAENVELAATIPENTTLVEVNKNYAQEEIAEGIIADGKYLVENESRELKKENITLEGNKTVNLQYMVKVNEDLSENKNIETRVSIKDNKQEKNASFRNVIAPASLSVSLALKDIETNKELISGYEYKYVVELKNLSSEEQKNIQVSIEKNDAIDILEIVYDNGEEEYTKLDGENLTFTINSLPANSTLSNLWIVAKVKNVENNNSADLTVKVKDSKNNEYTSNKVSRNIAKFELNASLATDAKLDENGYIHPGDKVKYEIKVKNTGTLNANEVTIKDDFSNYLNINSFKVDGKDYEYKVSKNYDQDYDTLYLDTALKAGEEVTIEIGATVDKDLQVTDILKITNKAYAAGGSSLAESEESTLIVKPYEESSNVKVVGNVDEEGSENPVQPQDPDEPQNPDQPQEPTVPDENKKTYSISGKVWIDKNQNGAQDSGEERFAGIKVNAIDVVSNKTVATTTTESNGEYTLTNLPEGEYLVSFEYDTEKYVVTLYQQKGINSDKNSDAVTATKMIDDAEKTVAITDSIKLNSNISNIDLGLVEAKIFDLELKKVVSKMIVTNSAGTKTYEYKDTELAKLEIRSRNLNNSNVVIEYKMLITNKGEAAGYVKNIVDYIPSSLTFSSSVNPDWYQKGNYIYNSSLANTKIEAGETKEVTLILTKAMTESNTGLTNNRAEIESAYTSLGVEDRNSIPGNNKDGENDTGSANVLITPSTGEAYSYVALTLSIIVLICGAAYLVNKKILIKKIQI